MEMIPQKHKEYDESNAEGSEEGEILDSMDSEEEHNMRQRIYELEAKNAELEKIARISSDYTNQYSYIQTTLNVTPYDNQKLRDVARIPSDASPISSDEFEPVKKHVKRKRRTSCSEAVCKYQPKIRCTHKRRHRPNDCENHRSKLRRSQKMCNKKQNKVYFTELNSPVVPNCYFETISLDSDEDVNQKGIASNSDDDNKPLHLNREELRFALARDKTDGAQKSKNLLKDRLCNSSFADLRKNEDVAKTDALPQNIHEVKAEQHSTYKDEVISQEEQELRLIALKSAVLKKHLARKKRNAEVAYSPTDFEPVLSQPKYAENIDAIEEELNELEDVMEISPMASPKLALSPLNEVELSCGTFYEYAGDNNSVDMDIAESESDNEEQLDQNREQRHENSWCPIVLAPLSTQEPQGINQLQQPLPMKYGNFDPEMQYFLDAINDEEPPPPPPPFNRKIITTHNDSKNTVFELLEEKTDDIDYNISENQFSTTPLLFNDTISNQTFHVSHSDKESDEEASALRAVLLSRLNQKKRRKAAKSPTVDMDQENMSTKSDIESVLQKALRRLKSSYSSSHSNTKENKIKENNGIYEDFSNDTLENCPQTVSEEEDLVQTPFGSSENSNSKTLNDESRKSNTPYFGEKTSQNISYAVESVTTESIDTPPNDYPKNDLNPISEPSLPDLHNINFSKKCALETFSNAQTEELKIPSDYEKDKQSVMKTQPIASSRVQPLTVKNTFNQLSIINTKPAYAHQLPTPLKRVRSTNKIVRRNKVINREVTTSIKRATSKASPTPLTHPKVINDHAIKTNSPSSIPMEKVPPKITVKKLIINIRQSETETSDEDFVNELSLPGQNSVLNIVKRYDDTYNANASPLELVMNSDGGSHGCRLETPPLNMSRSQEVISPNSVAFEKKLDSFLKNIRAKETEQSKKHSPVKHPVDEKTKFVNTPTAVRHLPLSSQDEYRRLVHRMKSLEKQKKTRKSDDDKSYAVAFKTKKVNSKESRLNVLNSYEKSFTQTSENIVALLNQSLSLVAEAKRAKLAKLRHEQRLKELRLEMNRLTAEVRHEELKLNSMKPHLGKSNQFLINLKKKSKELLYSANKLGKSIKGDTYSFLNLAGEEISSKSKKLQAEIRLVNALRPDNFEELLLSQNKESDAKLVQDSVDTPKTVEQTVPAQNQELSMKRLPVIASCSGNQKHSKRDDNEKSEVSMQMNLLETSDEMGRGKLQENLDGHTDDNCRKSDEPLQTVRYYISPLEHLKNNCGFLDFNAILCPFEMWGKCADEGCVYLHMTERKEKGTDLVKHFKNFL